MVYLNKEDSQVLSAYKSENNRRVLCDCFIKIFKKGGWHMKCLNCNKKIDEVDCSCGWCTFCGTLFDVNAYTSAADKQE